MGWLGKLFGGGTASIDSLRKAVQQKRFADARLLAEQLIDQGVADNEAAELAELQTAAGDGLARLNLEEARGFRQAGEAQRAAEHLELARELARSAELREEIENAMTAAGKEFRDIPAASSTQDTAGCSGCGSQSTSEQEVGAPEFPDPDSQLDLILTSYPPDIAEHYRNKGESFRQALLSSNSGDDAGALPLWQQVADEERDAWYYFEFGSALARAGQPAEARAVLEKALDMAPGLLLASEALIPVLVVLEEIDAALQHLQELLERGQDPAFCHAQLTMINLRQGETEQALQHARLALTAGVADYGFLQLASSLLEQAGQLQDAEAVLRRLPAGGCGGGFSLPMAEFLLRQNRELGKVLDTFNAACRQEPDNPRWQLRVAQTYLARKWRKEGMELLKKVVGDPRLEPELQREAEQLLMAQQS